MSDTYVECLVKAKQSGLAKFGKVLFIVITVIFGMGAFVLPGLGMICLIIAVITGVIAYVINLFTDLEYEYLYLDRELVVDKVMAKSKRKRVATFTVDRIEMFAPINSYHLDNFKNRNVKVRDYSIGEVQQPDLRYAMYYEGGEKVLFSPTEPMVKALKNVAPRKVFMD